MCHRPDAAHSQVSLVTHDSCNVHIPRWMMHHHYGSLLSISNIEKIILAQFLDEDAINLILLWFEFLSALSPHTYLLYASGWESFIQLAHNITWWMAMEQISSELCVNGRISIGWYLSVSAVPKLSVGVHSIGSPDWCVQISISPIFGSDGGMPTTQVASDLGGGGGATGLQRFQGYDEDQ